MNNNVDGIRLGEFCQFKKEIRNSAVNLFGGLVYSIIIISMLLQAA